MRNRTRNSLLGLMAVTVAMLVSASPAAAIFDIVSYDGGAFLENGEPATQAGSHPHSASAEFRLSTAITPGGQEFPTEDLEDAITQLPPGVIGNPQAVPACPVAVFSTGGDACAAETQIGLITLFTEISTVPGETKETMLKLFNLEAPHGTAALLGFFPVIPVYISAKLRTGGDYGVTAVSKGNPQSILVSGVKVVVWGVPADHSHDKLRGNCLDINGGVTGNSCPSKEAANPKAFFTLPTSCEGPGPSNSVSTDLTVTSWQGGEDSSFFLSHDNNLPTPNPIGVDGCGALEFAPTLEARPTTNVADAPSGLDVALHIPQDDITDPDGLVEAHLRDTTVTLPEGLVVNPSGANGLGACSPAQIDIKGPAAANCPEDSKVGTVEVETPLLDHPVKGAVYVATPHQNPFNSLLALYIAVEDPISGVVIKLAGRVDPDPVTGRLSSTFEENPQLPFEDFRLKFFGGARASLRTPSVCATYETTSSLTPWSAPDSGPPATPSDTWTISQGHGGACPASEAALQNAPGFDAGSLEPLAGRHSPFVLNLRREEGTQRFAALSVSPPQGLVAKLAGTTRCSEAALAAAAAHAGRAEEASPSCPASSQVGSVVAAAGSGPAPYYAKGAAYLTGPYKGAPLSLAIITPATAGPFDLGTIVVRTALQVDSKTARISAISDPLPRILEGIPLDIRSVQVKLDRPNFTLNPTSCDPMAVEGQLTSTLGQIASLQSRFQLAECTRLPFKPKMTMRLKGGTKRGGHPALTVTLTPRPGDANLASISVALPRSEFLDQAHIGTVCTRVQFAADACPAASIYGKATVITPLLDEPLTGNVYLRSSDNLLPDLVPDLRGPASLPLKLESSGRTDSIRGEIRNTFDFVPDTPFSKLTVQLQGAKKGLLVNSRDICKKTYRATVKYGAHNGLRLTDNPVLRAKCLKKAKKHHAAR